MTRWIAILLVSSSACVAPTEREVIVPDSLLVVVLADLHLADARARLPDAPTGLRDSVLVFHGLDEETFRRAMDGFAESPDELISLSNAVMDRLNAERTP